MYPNTVESDSLFESIRQAYSSFPPDFPNSAYIDLSATGDAVKFADPYHFFSHLETSTTNESVPGIARTASFSSDRSSTSNAFFSYQHHMRLALLPVILSGVVEYSFSTPGASRAYCGLRGLAGGFLSAASRTLFPSTPLLGDVASLAIFTAMKRSTSRDVRLSVYGGIRAVAAARAVEQVCIRSESSQAVKFACMFSSSIISSFIVRHLVSRIT